MGERTWRIGMVGLGKLGLPVATAMAIRGADVMGFDLDPKRMSYEPQPYQETGPDGTGDFNHYLRLFNHGTPAALEWDRTLQPTGNKGRLRFGTLEEVVAHADILFVAVQTPHDPAYEGITPVPRTKRDFDYTHLCAAVGAAAVAKRALDEQLSVPVIKPLAVISTVLPGTMSREIEPLLPQTLPLVYNPSFIAMGNTMRDFLNPEFVLLGVGNKQAADTVRAFYRDILPQATHQCMSVASAEMTKVAYNTAISQKIALANTIMEICHKTPGANVDEVTAALQAAYRRVTGPAYMSGGMGDGGGCHPRDNIALGWLAEQLHLSYDIFTSSMLARQEQTRWLAQIISGLLKQGAPPVIIIAGYAYKPDTNLTVGSPALLLGALLLRIEELSERIIEFWDPHVNPQDQWSVLSRLHYPVTLFIGCRHAGIPAALWGLPAGSVVVDPFRYVLKSQLPTGVKYVPVGIGPDPSAPKSFEVYHQDSIALLEKE